MIERFYLKDYLSFKEVELNLNPGLIVFTGPSGSGKSILMNSILTSLGGATCDASLCESSVTWGFDSEEFGVEQNDINVFKHIKKEKSRYFVNNQSLSKNAISSLASSNLRHLSLKDFSDFENENLLLILDSRIESKNYNINELKEEYKKVFLEHKTLKKELDSIVDEQKRIVELKEFANYEIKKIADLDPKLGEDEELLKVKKELSKKEKVLEQITLANSIFDSESAVFSTLDLLDVDTASFNDAMNELRATLEGAEDRFSALDDVDIEEVLNRIEELSELKRRYGGVQEAVEYKDTKLRELQKYENIEITLGDLDERVKKLEKKINELALKLTALRKTELPSFLKDLNRYLKELYLRDASVSIENSKLDINGSDNMVLRLNDTELQKVSTGEFNRLRLAVLALKSEFMNKNGGVLMLDEIDANLSGEESMSVAKVLKHLSNHFQIFVISHQPQLTSMGDQHFLVHKNKDESLVSALNNDERVNEIARIISGENVSKEAIIFAKELLQGKNK